MNERINKETEKEWIPRVILTDALVLSHFNEIKKQIDSIFSLLPESTELTKEIKWEIRKKLNNIFTSIEDIWNKNTNTEAEAIEWNLYNYRYIADAIKMHDQITEEIRSWNIITSEWLVLKIKEFFEMHFPWMIIWIYNHIQSQWWFTDYEDKIDYLHRQQVLREKELWEKWEIMKNAVDRKKFFYLLSPNWVISWAIPLTQSDELYSLVLYFEKAYDEWTDIVEVEKRFYAYVRIIWFIIEQELKNIRTLYRDALTWCHTKDFFNKHIHSTEYSVIAIDLDKFKEVNDKYWHSWWDQVLVSFWKILQSCVRKWEWESIRLSWDEFCILVKNIDWNTSNIKNVLKRLEAIKNTWNSNIELKNINTGENETVTIQYTHWISINDWLKELWDVYRDADNQLMISKSKSWIAYRIACLLQGYDPDKKNEILALANSMAINQN